MHESKDAADYKKLKRIGSSRVNMHLMMTEMLLTGLVNHNTQSWCFTFYDILTSVFHILSNALMHAPYLVMVF